MKNKGYTLVELIIVIAIMAILAGMSFITIGIINQAKCSAAVTTVDNQLSSCLIRTKAVSNVATPMCMVVVQRNDGTFAIMTGKLDSSGALTYDDPNVDDNCEAILPRQIHKIEYTPSPAAQEFSAANGEMVIQFVKSDGSVKYGAGEYKMFTQRQGGEHLCATIVVEASSGKHYIK